MTAPMVPGSIDTTQQHRGAVVARGAHNPKVHRSKRCDAKQTKTHAGNPD